MYVNIILYIKILKFIIIYCRIFKEEFLCLATILYREGKLWLIEITLSQV